MVDSRASCKPKDEGFLDFKLFITKKMVDISGAIAYIYCG